MDVVAGLALPNLVGQNISTIQGWAGRTTSQLNVHAGGEQPAAGHHRPPVPRPGTPGGAGQTTVTVSVSNGPPEVPDPRHLRARPSSRCSSELQQLGFQVDGRAFGPGQKVFVGDPSGQAPSGSTITVYYGGF